MNPYFLFLYIFSSIYYSLGLDTIVTAVKYIKMAGSVLTPDKKSSVEKLRGNILKINITDGDSEYYYLLPYASKPKTWTRVEAVLKDDCIPSIEESLKTLENQDNIIVVDDDLQSDILEAEKGGSCMPELGVSPRTKYKHLPKHDVTDMILPMAGPGKDFFGLRVCPHHINRNYACLIFHDKRTVRIFEQNDILNL